MSTSVVIRPRRAENSLMDVSTQESTAFPNSAIGMASHFVGTVSRGQDDVEPPTVACLNSSRPSASGGISPWRGMAEGSTIDGVVSTGTNACVTGTERKRLTRMQLCPIYGVLVIEHLGASLTCTVDVRLPTRHFTSFRPLRRVSSRLPFRSPGKLTRKLPPRPPCSLE